MDRFAPDHPRHRPLRRFAALALGLLLGALPGCGAGGGTASVAGVGGGGPADGAGGAPGGNGGGGPPTPPPREYRSIDGRGNDTVDVEEGAAGIALRRVLPSAYGDGLSTLAGADRPNPRAISNAVCAQTGDEPNAAGATDMLWQWGQFLDHDLSLTPGAEPQEDASILVPTGDAAFDPLATGIVVIPFSRSAYVDQAGAREQLQAITAWIDGSQVYGSDAVRALALRTNDGTGRLRTSAGDLLPFNDAGLPNAGGSGATLFLAGDIRANEQVGLACLHTLFVREHNRQADLLRQQHPELDGDGVYEEARRRVGALLQVITYEEFLPLLLGRGAIPPYAGYRPELDARIDNSFSTAAYRLGHSLLSARLLRLDASGAETLHGHLSLRDAFFRPDRLVTEGGIEPVLRGLSAQAAQELDTHVVDDVRSFLFGPPGAGGLDLAALNIQRGRDHGLPSYAAARAALGLAPRTTFAAIARDGATAQALALVYRTVDDVDLWIGALAEMPVRGAMVGETLREMLVSQFRRLRDGDRFWYEARFDPDEVADLAATRLADVIRRNTDIGGEIDRDVFRVGAERRP
ncbi:MAG: peroxidase family protein [Planctomycetota bacterium]